jgi:hypothetical protein
MSTTLLHQGFSEFYVIERIPLSWVSSAIRRGRNPQPPSGLNRMLFEELVEHYRVLTPFLA